MNSIFVRHQSETEREHSNAVGPAEASVGGKPDEEIREIEQTQEALRESIEQAKELADRAQSLLQKHKKTVEDRNRLKAVRQSKPE